MCATLSACIQLIHSHRCNVCAHLLCVQVKVPADSKQRFIIDSMALQRPPLTCT
jgi:hypothetical protein